MFNRTEKYIVYLNNETLVYMYMDYTGNRSYPVMKKLYSTLCDGFTSNWLVTPLSIDSIPHFIKDNRIDVKFLDMMNGIGNVQFLQRFTIKILQLIRIINSYYDNTYKKPFWRDSFSGNPDEKYSAEFSKYSSMSAKNVYRLLEREKKNSQILEHLHSYKTGEMVKKVAQFHFFSLWEKSSDLISPYLPRIGSPETYMKEFLENDEIQDIPQFHILSSVFYPLLDTYGIEKVEAGLKDKEIIAAEMLSILMPYCHYYVTTADIAELVIMKGFNYDYKVKVYDDNESSLYKLINDINEAHKLKSKMSKSPEKKRTDIKRGPSAF
ncbi:hypothetical protein ACFL30_02045 [Candidatus Latescibacterota bacterium]